jgi:putative membrane protein
MPYMYQHGGFPWARGLLFIIFLMIALAIVVWAIALLQRGPGHTHRFNTGHGASGYAGSSDAMRILDERFARGEIDAEEYQKRRELLRSTT